MDEASSGRCLLVDRSSERSGGPHLRSAWERRHLRIDGQYRASKNITARFGCEPRKLDPDAKGIRVLCSAAMLSIHVLLDAAVHLAQCDRAGLFLLHERTHELCSVALLAASTVMHSIRVPNSHGVAGLVVRTGVTMNLPNTDKVLQVSSPVKPPSSVL